MSPKVNKVKSSTKSDAVADSSNNVDQVVQQTQQEQTTQAQSETKKQRGGNKTKKVETPEPVQATTVPETATTNKKGGKKAKQAEPKTQEVEAKQAKPKTKVQKGGKKAKQDEPVENTQKATPDVEQEGGKANNVDVEDDEDQPQTGSKLRYFKLIYNDEIQGRYCGKKPKQAANKAFSSIIKEMKKGGEQHGGVNVDINFTIKECTRNSKHKEYKYVGKRETLSEPVKVSINNEDGSVKEIVYNFHNKIQKAPKA